VKLPKKKKETARVGARVPPRQFPPRLNPGGFLILIEKKQALWGLRKLFSGNSSILKHASFKGKILSFLFKVLKCCSSGSLFKPKVSASPLLVRGEGGISPNKK